MVENAGETGDKLRYGQKPFSQIEVEYTLTATSYTNRCETCRFFRHGSGYDPCLIVPNNEPLPIVNGGHCNQWLETKIPEGFYITLSEVDDELASVSLDAGMASDSEKVEKPFLDMSQESGFKVVQDRYWVAWYSNNFRDKDGEVFAESSIDNYNDKVNSGEWDAPELWMFHEENLKHGKALKTFRIGHFQMAVGIFDDPDENPIVEPLIKYYQANPVTMSHGYFYDPAKFSDNTYYWHRTFEISTLKPGREANPYFTSLQEVNEMKSRKLAGDDRKFVASIIGEDLLTQMENKASSKGSLLESLKIDFKAKGDDKEDDMDDEEDKEDDEKMENVFEKMTEGEFASFIINAKIAEATLDAVQQAHEGIKLAANSFKQSDDRLGEIETKIERLSQLVFALVEPNAGSKSILTKIIGENADVDALIDANQKQGKTRQKSLVEQLAEYAGDDASIYDQAE